MRSKNTVLEKVLPTTKPGMFIEVTVGYDIGGMNYFAGVSMARGYYLSVGPVGRSVTESGHVIRSYRAFSAPTVLLIECKRKSPKVAEQAVELAKTREAELIARVLEKNGLTLCTEAEAPPIPKDS